MYLQFYFLSVLFLVLTTNTTSTTNYCNYLKRINLKKFLIDDNKTLKLKINPQILSTLNFTDELIFPSSKNDFENDFKFQKINLDHIQIRLNDKKTPEKILANQTIKLVFGRTCSVLLEFYLEKDLPQSDQSEYNSKYLNATFISLEAWKHDLIADSRLKIDLNDYLPSQVAEYSIVCLRCSGHLEFKVTENSSWLQIKSSDQFFMQEKSEYEDIALMIINGPDQENFYLNIRILNFENERRFKQIYNSDSSRSRRYVIHNDDMTPQVVSLQQKKTHLLQGGYVTLKTAQLVINEETVGLQTRLKIYDHVWVDYQLNASDYVKERIQLIAPDNPILNITKPFDFELGGAEHTFQIVFTRKSDQRTIKDIKPITIKVLDINDEPPVWSMDEPIPYTAVVERDPRPNLLIFQFLAQDPDSQSQIVYKLHSKTPNTSRIMLTKDGKLITSDTVSGTPFQYDTYKILVSASDAKAEGNKSHQEIFAELTIQVGKKSPQFYQSEYRVNISEHSPSGFNVVQMRAKSFNPDPFNKKHLRYSLLTRQGHQSAEFSIYSENGTVVLARQIDYESDVREFNLVVYVTEQSGWLLSASAMLNIFIEDFNDNAPQFTLSEYVRSQPVPEDLQANTFVIEVEVQDRDAGRNSEIVWQVSSGMFYVRAVAEGETTRARIYNFGGLDFEIPQHLYRFDVLACDKGEVSLCATAKVSIPISNVNDEKPKFDQKVILATLDENVPSGAYVTTIQATDGDGDRIAFRLKDTTGPFEINRDSGIVKIKTNRKIDPNEDYYNLTIYAQDDGSCCCPNAKKVVTHKTQNYNCKVVTNQEEATLVIKIRDINDHAPKFHDCSSYSQIAQVEEEKPIGTNVIQVEALDRDKGENGEVEYEILSTHNNERNKPFRIDPISGLIQTNVLFDRESNGNVNEYSITVKAKDRGKPHPLSDACSFRIKIVDINDHAPSFYEPDYKLSIKYDTKKGQSIQRIIANDLDSGKNAEIKYRIEQAGSHAHFFTVDELTGMISLASDIPHNIAQPIMFNLIAEDSGPHPKSTSVSVSVNFADRDNEPPKWLAETEKRFERTVRIPEAISLNQVVETLDAESNYAPNSKLIFDFSPKPQPESFIIQQEKIPGTNRYRGKIIVYQPLDAETQNTYELHVRVQNAAAQPMEITGVVRVEILDSNDNIPLFTSPTYLANVSENSPYGTYVTKVTAEDKDISAPNNVVVYTIIDQDHGRKFQIDPHTGNITTRAILDREQTKVYFIDVTACDSAMSDRPNMNTPNCRTANVRIDVADTNDNQPFFNETLYYTSIAENAERGTPMLTVQANDADENSQLRYIITHGNDDNVFGVRELIGEIYVANNGKLDYETLDQYFLTLTVSDGIHNATTKIKIDLIDVNDNPPVFTEMPPYEIELVEEDISFPRVILKINATDGDIKRPNTIVYKINYNYTHNGSSFRPFSINPNTGEIILQEKLDRDYPDGRPVWSFNVIASDEGGNKGSMDSTAVVNVRLLDINDNAPVFDRPPYVGHVMENLGAGELIMTVQANDYDDPLMGLNAVLRYQIAENKKFGNLDVFSINETTGQIFQNLRLDREQIDKYTIEVCATDGSGKRGCGQITIYIDDANDQPPHFQSSTYTETIPEDFPIGDRVLVVTATDRDIGLNAELTYSLKTECLVRKSTYTGNDAQDCVGGRDPKYFKVDTERDANSGFIKLAKSVNFDPPDFHRLFKLNVSVSDGVAQNFTTIFINIADVNDEAPQFREPVKNIPILESISPLTLITSFSAEDLDTLEANRKFSYSLDRKSEGSHEFTIDQEGNLFNLDRLDREKKDKYILRIFAIDEGYPPQTGIATLNLELIDVNDNFPQFAENYRPVVMENTPPGQFVVEVRAKDLDDPSNGPPFMFELPNRLTYWPDGPKKSFNMTFVQDEMNGMNYAKIFTMASFDREGSNCALGPQLKPSSYQYEHERESQCKTYKIPIYLSDSGKPPMSGINYLTVTIGDVNDNLHYPAIKKILIYDYLGSVLSQTTQIGTVYSKDKDDWDMSDKEFKFIKETDDYILTHFDLIENINDSKYDGNFVPGTIMLKPGIRLGEYEFQVSVKDLTRSDYEAQVCTVKVSVRGASEDVVRNSGSLRLTGVTGEKLVEVRYSPNEKSMLDEIRSYLANDVYKLDSDANLEFFSVMNHKTLEKTVDLRFSAHNSPLHRSERLNGLLAHNKTSFQQWLSGLDPFLRLHSIGIDECAESERTCKSSGCKTTTHYSSHLPALINANQTALVGVHAEEKAECMCKSLQGHSQADLNERSCDQANYCLNSGMCLKEGSVQRCQCPKGFDGPRCQKTVRHFNATGGFVWLPILPQCQDLVVSMEFVTTNSKGLLFYNGPINDQSEETSFTSPSRYQKDFLALQLDKGKLLFQVRQGITGKTHSYILTNFNRTLNNGVWHRIDIYKSNFKYRITIDRCIDTNYSETTTQSQNDDFVVVDNCEHEFQVQIHDLFVNTNQYYPLQMGGLYDRNLVPRVVDYKGNFVGCIRNFKVNGELYDMQIETSTTIGFASNSVNSCPRADNLCNPTNITNYCLNGICDANYFKSECLCKPGYRGVNCEFKALPFDFQTPGINKRAGSYLKYRYVYLSDNRNSGYDAYLKKFTKIQLLFRTRENTTNKYQTLFQITSPNRAQYIYMEIFNARIQFRYNIGGGENVVCLSEILVNDGKWHFAKAERYGKEASLILDDGEGFKMNYTFGLPSGAHEMDVDRDSIFLGAKVVQIKVSGYEISRDYSDSCMMDVRFDDKPLPYTQQEERAFEEIAIKMESVNVKDGCASVDYCKGIFCPSNQKCVDEWRWGECQCPKGQQLNGSKCQDLNDCQLCYREGTKFCEKFESNRIVSYENFNENGNYQSINPVVGDFPPDRWYVVHENHEVQNSPKVWHVQNDQMGQIGQGGSGFKCVCRKGFFGQYCNAQASKRVAVFMSYEAVSIIILSFILFLFLILIFVVYSRAKRPVPKHYMMGVDPNDEVRETIINYVEEGCPDVDQSHYDITQLVKPLDPSANNSNLHQSYSDGSTGVDGEFPTVLSKHKPGLQEMSYIRRDVPPVTEIDGLKSQRPQNSDVGDFINSKLREIDNDPVQPPYDSLQEYAYEGEGSMYGSTLSSLDTLVDEIQPQPQKGAATSTFKDPDQDLDQLKNWGPKFNKISNIYGLKSKDEDLS